MINKSIHSPYCELSAEDRMLFSIFGLAAAARYRSCPPTEEELIIKLSAAWDAERLCPNDLSNPYRMTDLLEKCFAPSDSADVVGSVTKEIG